MTTDASNACTENRTLEAAMKAVGTYDSTLQMFVERPRELDLERLTFLRWLAERGELEHAVAGPPGGAHAGAARREPTAGWPSPS